MPKPAKFDNGNKLSKQEYSFRVKNQPVNKSLYAKVKNEAKRKFKKYPSSKRNGACQVAVKHSEERECQNVYGLSSLNL